MISSIPVLPERLPTVLTLEPADVQMDGRDVPVDAGVVEGFTTVWTQLPKLISTWKMW